MDKKIHKFTPIRNKQLCRPMTLLELVGSNVSYNSMIQYVGIKDANNREVYKGDVLELRITDELMDPKKDTFYNSNLGKAMSKDRSIKSVICVLSDDEDAIMGVHYSIYFMREDGVIAYEDGKPETQARGSDHMFPSYLCCKGAKVIANINIDTDVLERIKIYSNWGDTPNIFEVMTVNCDDIQVYHAWETLEDFKSEWFDEMFSGPSLDDELIYATVQGKCLDNCKTFEDALKIFAAEFKFKY